MNVLIKRRRINRPIRKKKISIPKKMGATIQIKDPTESRSFYYILPDVVIIVNWLWNVPIIIFKNDKYVQPVKLEGEEEANLSRYVYMVYYFFCFALFILFWMALKSPVFLNNTLIHGSLPYQKELSVQSGEIILNISYWSLWTTLYCAL